MNTMLQFPDAFEAEKAYLGILINKSDILLSLDVVPSIEDFFEDSHKIIAQALYSLHDAGNVADFIVLTEMLSKNNNFEKIGGLIYLLELSDKGVLEKNIGFYINKIIKTSQRRQLLEYGNFLLTYGQDEHADLTLLVEKAETQLFSIFDRHPKSDYASFEKCLSELVATLNYRIKHYKPGQILGIKSGYPFLDAMVMGFKEGELIILAARPSRGKTAFTLNIAHNIAIKQKIPTAFFSIEMSKQELIARLVSMCSKIPGAKIRQNMINEKDIATINETFPSDCNIPLFIYDTPTMSMNDIKMHARKLVKKEKVKIIFIDYLGIISLSDASNTRSSVFSRYERFTEISGALKSLARELAIPIIVLSQLTRDAEEREPTLASIRESGAIEQDADIVMMLHREKEASPFLGTSHPIKLIIAKQRNGPVGVVHFLFDPSVMEFKEIKKKDLDSMP